MVKTRSRIYSEIDVGVVEEEESEENEENDDVEDDALFSSGIITNGSNAPVIGRGVRGTMLQFVTVNSVGS